MGNNEDVLKILKFLLIIWQKNDLKKDLLPLVRHEVVGPKLDLTNVSHFAQNGAARGGRLAADWRQIGTGLAPSM